jgi:hypothetical protein
MSPTIGKALSYGVKPHSHGGRNHAKPDFHADHRASAKPTEPAKRVQTGSIGAPSLRAATNSERDNSLRCSGSAGNAVASAKPNPQDRLYQAITPVRVATVAPHSLLNRLLRTRGLNTGSRSETAFFQRCDLIQPGKSTPRTRLECGEVHQNESVTCTGSNAPRGFRRWASTGRVNLKGSMVSRHPTGIANRIGDSNWDASNAHPTPSPHGLFHLGEMNPNRAIADLKFPGGA